MQLQKQKASCQHCGAEFLAYPSELARGRKRFCRKTCYYASLRTRGTPIEERFWKYVQKTDTCWLWTGHTHNGYGTIQSGYRVPVLAHRLSWEMHNDPIPKGMLVCHNCPGGDNPSCVNPAHLWLGSQAQNNQDMFTKKRHMYGELSTSSKLTEVAVIDIRARFAAGNATRAELAKEYGVCRATISDIARGKSWKHIP